jgi:hypothetical protein
MYTWYDDSHLSEAGPLNDIVAKAKIPAFTEKVYTVSAAVYMRSDKFVAPARCQGLPNTGNSCWINASVIALRTMQPVWAGDRAYPYLDLTTPSVFDHEVVTMHGPALLGGPAVAVEPDLSGGADSGGGGPNPEHNAKDPTRAIDDKVGVCRWRIA